MATGTPTNEITFNEMKEVKCDPDQPEPEEIKLSVSQVASMSSLALPTTSFLASDLSQKVRNAVKTLIEVHGRFICCEKLFPNRHRLQIHCRQHYVVQACFCGKVYKSRDTIVKHVKSCDQSDGRVYEADRENYHHLRASLQGKPPQFYPTTLAELFEVSKTNADSSEEGNIITTQHEEMHDPDAICKDNLPLRLDANATSLDYLASAVASTPIVTVPSLKTITTKRKHILTRPTMSIKRNKRQANLEKTLKVPYCECQRKMNLRSLLNAEFNLKAEIEQMEQELVQKRLTLGITQAAIRDLKNST